MRTHGMAALVGLLAALAVLATAEAVAVFVSSSSSPFFAVGQLAIDLAPAWLKESMIALFGTGDKIALFVILGLVVIVFAALAGVLERRRPPVGVAILVIFSAVAVVAVQTRPEASALWAFPTVLGMIAGVLVLRSGIRRLGAWLDVPEAAHAGMQRRQFLTFAGVTGATALIVAIGARAMNASTAAVTAIRQAIALPTPATAAPAIDPGTSLDVDGISTLITPNEQFYRIDVALQVPQIDPDGWQLKITGLVDTEVTIGYAELLALPLTEHVTTIACVSNEVGGGLIGNATWLGYPIRELLARAGVQSGADMVLSSGPDGFSAGTPIEALTDPNREALLAVGMNGEPLPTEHGFPARMIVPGLFGYVSATKWVTEMKVTRFADAEGYWTPRGWDALGPVVTQSRIDVPLSGQTVASGTVAIAGVAWAPHTGIAGVEVRVDNGSWQKATLAPAISDDTWVQWVLQWQAPAGAHTIAVRATDKSGYTQTDRQAPPAPSGATGWDTIRVTVEN
ncbi:DMSO/TMAO reductase YedYZ, molybdopterin-dependent catalytic subunit [Agreia bicolorata]|uniref:DMSO/TMAO reductase YedYZ, molybdopterin-dependent catalytic subunit n=1 Tax=Agreia bicolorata TaxID=110935 RepID=A0A1T4XI61_9MICO|nr:molybdopterin-dependent oxidoreductase [Agreia bicolorata]SKA89240.1 DMSO/TMAO reductase YedYZ, molybdopterin-dependent catalytic subunit [Agreia bicolorata]